MFRKILSLVTVAMMGGIMVLASGQPAEAKTCKYEVTIMRANNTYEHIVTTGKGAVKRFACERAKLKCQKKLTKRRNEGKISQQNIFVSYRCKRKS